MLLDRIDIDIHGPLARIAVGPFSQQLNVIAAAAGSGKTALVRFLRDSLTGTTPAYDGMAQSSGRVVWAAADGLYHCRRQPDGTREGRRLVQFESRLGGDVENRWNRPSVIVDLPASIVDGIVTDTTLSSVRRVVRSVVRSGLDRDISGPEDHGQQAEILALRAELAQLREALHHRGDVDGVTAEEHHTRDRLAALMLELQAIDARRQFARQNEAVLQRARREREAMSHAVQEVDRLRGQETDLRKRIAGLQRSLAGLEEQAGRDEQRIAITQRTRSRVHWLNQQIDRLRRVLSELRELGDHWFGGQRAAAEQRAPLLSAALLPAPAGVDPPAAALSAAELEITDRGWLRDRHTAATSSCAAGADSCAAAVCGATIAARLDSLCRLVDHLTGRLEVEQEHWARGEYSAAEPFATALSESERALQRMRRDASASDRDESGGDQRLLADPGWIDDSLRRRRIDSLRRAEQRRRLEEAADVQSIQGRSEDAFLITLRTIGTSLHCVSQRLRSLRAQRDWGIGQASWNEELWLPAEAVGDNASASLSRRESAEVLRRCERELVATLERLAQHRVGLLRRVAQSQQLPESLLEAVVADACILPAAIDQWLSASLASSMLPPSMLPPSMLPRSAVGDGVDAPSGCQDHAATQRLLEGQCRQLTAELERTVHQMNTKLAEAEGLRNQLSAVPVLSESDDDQSQRGRVEAEIHRLHRLLAAPAQPAALHRYRQCALRLRSLEAEQRTASPLAAAASGYLQRLSGGRLRNVAWQAFVDPPTGRRQVAVSIDSQPEFRVRPSDRYLVALAVRMAAADELSRRGRPLPLVIETLAKTAPPLQRFASAEHLPRLHIDQHAQDDCGGIHNFVSTLAEVSGRGRQIILLTDDRTLADAVAGAGGRSYRLDRSTLSAPLPVHDVNRSFDIQWREMHGIDDLPSDYAAATPTVVAADDFPRSAFDLPAVDAAAAGRTGVHPSAEQGGGDAPGTAEAAATVEMLDSQLHPIGSAAPRPGFTADEPCEPYDRPCDVVAFPTRQSRSRNGHGGAEASPFFLTGDSPIEQSPSIDVLAAMRLRGLGIVYVSQLLMASPQELAEKMQMADIAAATIRRWQSECRLVCGVSGLRGFDARVLVGCGVIHPRQVAEIPPVELVEKIEAFLATATGRRILQTGTRGEVARLTSWIAEARRSSRRGEAAAGHRPDQPARPRHSATLLAGSQPSEHPPWRHEPRGRKGLSRTRTRRATSANQLRGRTPQEMTGGSAAAPVAGAAASSGNTGGQQLKFYLHRQSAIVDAPAIGPRMAQRLADLKILTVGDLIKAKPAAIAAALKLRRVDESIIRSWQQQAQLVCCVPMLRGHDAQLLVAAGITEPQRLAQCDPQWLLSQIEPISRSRQGQAILRGGKQPDLTEIADWIRYAKRQRELQAA